MKLTIGTKIHKAFAEIAELHFVLKLKQKLQCKMLELSSILKYFKNGLSSSLFVLNLILVLLVSIWIFCSVNLVYVLRCMF